MPWRGPMWGAAHGKQGVQWPICFTCECVAKREAWAYEGHAEGGAVAGVLKLADDACDTAGAVYC